MYRNPSVQKIGDGEHFGMEIDVSWMATRGIAEAAGDGVFSVRTDAKKIPLKNGQAELGVAFNVFCEPSWVTKYRIPALKTVSGSVEPQICGDVIEPKANPRTYERDEDTLREMMRVLAPGGKLVIGESLTPEYAGLIFNKIDFEKLCGDDFEFRFINNWDGANGIESELDSIGMSEMLKKQFNFHTRDSLHVSYPTREYKHGEHIPTFFGMTARLATFLLVITRKKK